MDDTEASRWVLDRVANRSGSEFVTGPPLPMPFVDVDLLFGIGQCSGEQFPKFGVDLVLASAVLRSHHRWLPSYCERLPSVCPSEVRARCRVERADEPEQFKTVEISSVE